MNASQPARWFTLLDRTEVRMGIARTALASSPNNPRLLNDLARLLVASADSARRAIRADPNSGNFYNTMGLFEYRNDHWDEAISSLNHSVDPDKGTQPLNFFFLSMAYWCRGDKSEADRS